MMPGRVDVHVERARRGIVRGLRPHGTATRAPAVVVRRRVDVLLGDVARERIAGGSRLRPAAPPSAFFGRWYRVPAPEPSAGAHVVRGDAAASGELAPRRADDDAVADDDGRHGDGVRRIGVGDDGFPSHRARRGIERDDTGVDRAEEDHAMAERDAAVDRAAARFGDADLRLVAPEALVCAEIERGDDVVVRRDEESSVVDDRSRFRARAGLRHLELEERARRQLRDVGAGDLRERRVAGVRVIAAVLEPLAVERILEPCRGDGSGRDERFADGARDGTRRGRGGWRLRGGGDRTLRRRSDRTLRAYGCRHHRRERDRECERMAGRAGEKHGRLEISRDGQPIVRRTDSSKSPHRKDAAPNASDTAALPTTRWTAARRGVHRTPGARRRRRRGCRRCRRSGAARHPEDRRPRPLPHRHSRARADARRLARARRARHVTGSDRKIDEKWRDFRALQAAHPDRFFLVTTFDPFRFNEPDFVASTIAKLRADIAAGAKGVKVWKDIGMELKDDRWPCTCRSIIRASSRSGISSSSSTSR